MRQSRVKILHKWLVLGVLIASFGPTSRAQSSLSISSLTAAAGSTVGLNLSLLSTSGNAPAGLQWTFLYPAASVSRISVAAGPSANAAGKTISCAAVAAGYACAAAGVNQTTFADGVVAVVTITLTGTATTTPVSLSNTLAASPAGTAITVSGTAGSISVAATPPPPTVAVSVSPISAGVSAGQSQQFTATVTGSTNAAVTWSLSPPAGSVSNGLYTAPATVSAQQNVTLTATSQADSAKSASVNITLNPPAGNVGAVGQWSFDTADISGTLVIDRSGNGMNGILSNATSVAGKVNQALTFNGVDSVVTVPDDPKLQFLNSMTLAAWIRTVNNSRREAFIGKYDATGAESGYILQTLPSGAIQLRVGGYNVAGTREVADTTPVNDGQWHHVAVVITLGQNVRFYIDGNLRSAQPALTLASSNATPLWLGTVPFNPYFNLGLPFTGSLDNVQIFNQALSASAVAVLAAGSQTTTSAGISVAVTPANVSLSSGQTQQFTAAISGSANTAVTWSVSASGGSISATGLYTAPASIATQQSATVTATSQADSAKSASVTITLTPPASTGSSAPVASWSFDNANISGTLVIDASGNGLNGILSGTTSIAGKVNQALSFNGVDSVVTVPDSPKLQFLNSMTISAWIRTVNNSRREAFIGKYDATGAESGYILQTLPSGGIQLRVGGNNVLGTREVADATPVNNGQWRHVAVVIYLGQNVQFYVDGILRSTQPLLTLASPNAAPLWLGTLPFNPYFNLGLPFTGSLDSVQVFNQALSGAAVAKLAQ